MTITIAQTPELCHATDVGAASILASKSNHVGPTNFVARGSPIPNLPHAISGSLPTWQDMVELLDDEPSMTKAMIISYPRFIIHQSILKV